ncbi:tRNA (guanosine(46)-N7)-methyltransferase TrmB [Hyphomicrobiales bacterium]|nr:tRNA (guanosine(46)-N7)-methyltransferase TrmB [Hyphomicrobiales bacterium]
MEEKQSANRLYGRKKLYKLSDEKTTLLDDVLPKFIINIDNNNENLSNFSQKKEIFLEIGFGYGEHLAFQAYNNPNIDIIGAEPFLNGITNLLKIIVKKNIKNIKIYNHDALTLIKSIKPETISTIYILFPDPWPKTRHNKRRIINESSIKEYSRILKKDGKIIIATDSKDYQYWILLHMQKNRLFEWLVNDANDWRTRLIKGPLTKYEKKSIKSNNKPVYFMFKKNII